MNEMLIVVGVIFLVCVIIGYTKGFLKIVASLAATLATILLVSFLTPYVSSVVLAVTPLETIVQEKCMEVLTGGAEEGQAVEIPEELDASQDMQIELIENANIPDMFQQLLLENNNPEIYEALGVTCFSEYIGKYLAKLIANILSFLLTLLVVTIVVRIVLYIVGIIGDLPVIGGVNRLAGAVVGLGTGLVCVWVLFIIITLLYNTDLGVRCLQSIEGNEFLTYLYDHNILMNYITKFRG